MHPGFAKHRSVDATTASGVYSGGTPSRASGLHLGPGGAGIRSSSTSSNGGFRSLSSDSRLSLFCDAYNDDDTPLQVSANQGSRALPQNSYWFVYFLQDHFST